MMRALYTTLLIVVLWVALSLCFNLRSALLPDFLSVFFALGELLRSGDLFYHLAVTLLRVCIAVLISVLVAVPAGLVLASRPSIGKSFITVLDFFRGIPVAMLFPVFIIIFGIGELSRMAISLYLSLPILFLAAYYGGLENRDNAGRRVYLKVHEDRLRHF